MNNMTQPKNPAAVELGRKGGLMRAKRLTKEQLRAISLKANKKRWNDYKAKLIQ